jgi:hypothetical protein
MSYLRYVCLCTLQTMLGLSLPLISYRMTHVLFTLCVFVYVTNDAWLVFTSNSL